MYTPLALPSRVRRIALFVAVLVIAPALALLVPSGADTAGAAQGQRLTTRSRPSSSGPETTEDEEPATSTTRLRRSTTTEREPEPSTRSTRPATTARPSTTRRSANTATTPTTRATTMPTVPPSTETPELLVAGPDHAAAGEAGEEKGDGMSTSAALRWVIIGLVLVGLAIAGLTIAYWRHTRPRAADDDTGRGDGPGDGFGGPTPGAAPRFTPLAHGGPSGTDPYRPVSPVSNPMSWGSGAPSPAPGPTVVPRPTRASGPTAAPGPAPAPTQGWDPSPAVQAGERPDRPWGAS